MKLIQTLKKYLHHTSLIAKNSEDINNKINDLSEGLKKQLNLLNQKMNQLIIQNTKNTKEGLAEEIHIPSAAFSPTFIPEISETKENIKDILSRFSLTIAPKTYNTSHPDYDSNLVRNYPGKFFNADKDIGNPIFAELKKLMNINGEIPESNWSLILRESLEEARSVPYAEEVFEKKRFLEKYIDELQAKHHACYQAGWVNLEDALFLYWVVRNLKPKNIVQAGVCNGLSSAFMMLALAKNGSEGTLHVVDLPYIFNPNDSSWTIKGKAYGVIIPEGKSSGWLVPDAYRDRFFVSTGDAKDLLPGVLQKVGKTDMFYHDSDHSYDHMMFEFTEAKKHLSKNGVMIADDIAWNASLWDFADQYLAPAYNYRGSMGIVCF